MKRNFFLLAFLALSPLYAFGDYVPGRVRESAAADLTRESASGLFSATQTVHVDQFRTDGRGITGFRLRLDQNSATSFNVQSVQPSRCGRVYLASGGNGSRDVTLRLEEITPSDCGGRGDVLWRATLTIPRNEENASEVVLSGKPEFFILTQ